MGIERLIDLSGKTALVTGASSGLGAHFAGILAEAGANVAMAARRKDKLVELAEDLSSHGPEVEAFSLDVLKTESITDCVQAVSESFGRIDILVNNAGVSVTKPISEVTEEDWDFAVGTNLKGAFFMARSVAKAMMRDEGGGSIINIASILGDRVLKQIAPYAMAKAGLAQGTKAMALEWAVHGIRVNAIAPGYISTNINRAFLESDAGEKMKKAIPMRRFGVPSDLDGALMLLAGHGGAFMTGACLTVDGGHVLHM